MLAVPPSSPLKSGLDEDWVDADHQYPLICIVEEAKPQVRAIWVIDSVPQETVNKVEDVGTDGIKKTTGSLDYMFSKNPEQQKVECWVTAWDDETDVIEKNDYKTVDVYSEYQASPFPNYFYCLLNASEKNRSTKTCVQISLIHCCLIILHPWPWQDESRQLYSLYQLHYNNEGRPSKNKIVND